MANFYYIASPGFTDQQRNKIHKVEAMLDGFHAEYFSPFKEGDKLDMNNEDKDLSKLSIKCIFDKNIENIYKSDRMVAIVDEFDKGTAFEIGVFARNRPANYVMTQGLLLLGKMKEQVSEELNKIIHNKKNSDKFNLDNKDLPTYLRMGYLYGTHNLYSYSKGNLSSNVMTACAVDFHYQADLYKDTEYYYDTFEKFLEAKTGDLNILGTKYNFQLDAVRFASKVE